MSSRPRFATLDDAIEFARGVAVERDWRFEVLRRRPGRLVFETYDNQTYCSRRFQVRSDAEGTFRIIRRRFGTRRVFSWRVALIGFLVLVWLGINHQDETIRSNAGETLAARYGLAIAQLARLVLILIAVTVLLVLASTFRPSRRQARRLARTRLSELTRAMNA